jgi:hypothetical protein
MLRKKLLWLDKRAKEKQKQHLCNQLQRWKRIVRAPPQKALDKRLVGAVHVAAVL